MHKLEPWQTMTLKAISVERERIVKEVMACNKAYEEAVDTFVREAGLEGDYQAVQQGEDVILIPISTGNGEGEKNG